jgi:hypothetical protein
MLTEEKTGLFSSGLAFPDHQDTHEKLMDAYIVLERNDQ